MYAIMVMSMSGALTCYTVTQDALLFLPQKKGATRATADSQPAADSKPVAMRQHGASADISDSAFTARLANLSSSSTSVYERQVRQHQIRVTDHPACC